MKHLSFILIFIFVGAGCALPLQAQTAKSPARNAVFVAKPEAGSNGYEVQITLKYRFQLCAGDITLDGFRTKHEPLAYWYNGKRYTEAEIKGGCKFKTNKSDLYPNLDFTANIVNEFTGGKEGSGKWVWVNLTDWGGCLGDYGTGDFKYNPQVSGDKQRYIASMLSFFVLKNIKPKDKPNRDYDIEKCIEPKKEEPKKEEEKPVADCVEINGVCWATKNLGANSPQDYGNYYTWEEAKKNIPAGWRLPTAKELENLAYSTVGKWTEKGREFAGGKLFLPAAGFVGKNGKVDVEGRGCYWSSTYGGTWDGSFYYFFNSSHNYVGENYGFANGVKSSTNGNINSNGFSIRLVKE